MIKTPSGSKERSHKTGHNKRGSAGALRAVCAVVLASLAVAGGAAAIKDAAAENSDLQPPAPVIEMIQDDLPPADIPDDDEDEEKNRAERRRPSLASVIALPVYGFGWLILRILELFFKTVLPPLASMLIRWVIMTGAVLLALACAYKTIFPDRSLKEFFTKKNLVRIGAGTAFICLLCTVLPIIFPKSDRWIEAMTGLGGAAIVLAGMLSIGKKVRSIKAKLKRIQPGKK